MGVSVRTVRRVALEDPVTQLDAASGRRMGRPSVVEAWSSKVAALLEAEPGLMTLEILSRLRLEDLAGVIVDRVLERGRILPLDGPSTALVTSSGQRRRHHPNRPDCPESCGQTFRNLHSARADQSCR